MKTSAVSHTTINMSHESTSDAESTSEAVCTNGVPFMNSKRFSGARAFTSTLVALLASSLLAMAVAKDFPPGGDGGGEDGSDPTVGTLPMLGDTDDEFFDQTVTLRGLAVDVANAVIAVGGVGAAELIDLGNGEVWVRYYGDITLELDVAELTNVDVAIFTGFEGNGMSYSIAQSNGLGDVRRLPSGSSIALEPTRYVSFGLLDQTLFLGGLHQDGTRTMTALDYEAVDGVVVIRQDV